MKSYRYAVLFLLNGEVSPLFIADFRRQAGGVRRRVMLRCSYQFPSCATKFCWFCPPFPRKQGKGFFALLLGLVCVKRGSWWICGMGFVASQVVCCPHPNSSSTMAVFLSCTFVHDKTCRSPKQRMAMLRQAAWLSGFVAARFFQPSPQPLPQWGRGFLSCTKSCTKAFLIRTASSGVFTGFA